MTAAFHRLINAKAKQQETSSIVITTTTTSTSSTGAETEFVKTEMETVAEGETHSPPLNDCSSSSAWTTVVVTALVLLLSLLVPWRRRHASATCRRTRSPRHCGTMMKLSSASSDCDTDSFTSNEEEEEDEEDESELVKPLAEIVTPACRTNSEMSELQGQIRQLIQAVQSQSRSQSQPNKDLLDHVQRLEQELCILKSQVGTGEQRLQQLETKQENAASATCSSVGPDLLLQKTVVDLSCQVQDLEEKLQDHQDVTDATMSLWENQLDLHQIQTNKSIQGLQTHVSTVQGDLHRVETRTDAALQDLSQQHQKHALTVKTQLQALQHELSKCQQEWKAALQDGLSSWDDKLAAYKATQVAATRELDAQVQGLQGELQRARQQTCKTAQEVEQAGKKKFSFQVWRHKTSSSSKHPQPQRQHDQQARQVDAILALAKSSGDKEDDHGYNPIHHDQKVAIATKCDL